MSTAAARGLYTIAAGLLFMFATIEMALSAWLISRFNRGSVFTILSTRTRVRYTLFLSIWTMIFSALYLVLALGAVRMWGRFGSWASHLFSLAIGWIMWLSAAIAISSRLGGVLHCSSSGLLFCTQTNALQALAWLIFSWITVILLVMTFWGAKRMRKNEWTGYGSPLLEV